MLLPQENVESLQNLIFILDYKLKQPEESVLKMSYWMAKKRYSQFAKYQEDVKKEMEKSKSKAKSPSKKY
jgi:hypothetical protein